MFPYEGYDVKPQTVLNIWKKDASLLNSFYSSIYLRRITFIDIRMIKCYCTHVCICLRASMFDTDSPTKKIVCVNLSPYLEILSKVLLYIFGAKKGVNMGLTY